MNAFLWIIQILLAALFGLAGVMKATQPKNQLLSKLPWVKDFSEGMVKFIGIAESLGALGLILPPLIGLPSFLTPLAALGLCTIMVLATVYHLRKNERKQAGLTIALFVLCAIVMFGRW